MIDIYINNIKLKVNKNLTVLQACNNFKIEIPKFCFQENLQIAGNCRMCLVEIENSPKPVASCAMPLMTNMKIFTDTPLVQKARESVLEFLLINHPLDCPICDQASECDLQDQTMIFGSDRSRFFFKKRGVEDKYCGPFIKTIMTRCIHCTRCVRFANEICGIDDLGTTGRGNKTEINFYYPKIFNSEFSGNLVDLCPVGALTSKPYTFKARSWELKKKEGIDILDGIGSNIKIDIFNNEIVRILPKTNFNINKEWISNKTRYFFDSLKYQRLKYPLLKDNENNFHKISWLDALNLINQKLITTDSTKIKSIIGDLTDLESLFLLKKNLNKLGISNIIYERFLNNQNIKINSDLTSNFLFNNTLKSIEESDLCLIIGSDIRKEGSILNIHLINRLKKGNFKVAYIGNKIDFTYSIKHLGLTFLTLIDIIVGKHSFCKDLKKSKKPLIIIGENIINQKNGFFLLSKLKNLSFLNNNINFFNSQTSLINFFEITFSKTQQNLSNNSKLYYLFNTNLQDKLKISKNNFIIYQGHHFTKDAQNSNLILPGLTFLEKNGMYINLEGFIQKNEQILNLNTEQRKDSIIYRNIYKFLINKNQSKLNSFLKLQDILPYLLKKKIKIINNFSFNKKYLKININFLNSLIKNNYYTNILEQYSKILINSNKIIKNQSKSL
uniref:NADH dehydrogenase subunit 11 n=1 Tax=Phytophthora agathidicida TaxID=1642459 RepID=A0A8B0KGI4_9STRA|nr:NADH dehydrogenase subunit 11 [Phytophthora agathidicida]QTV76766.1 NADH dehydrogenase subunit 11 [Phytophthora agathidicida]DAD54846.1 TPA_asm: NADH dehydrogenase subunit 11 [Phytophthora agathidicida]DAD54924.1 TPA_asm: NADH dehydrogenase subunit 11 [Phytophthora agathidicida]DAD54963.1 TPA_asm: NADH dehydrogenase subunit 11 [Phytophthora agathidicida]